MSSYHGNGQRCPHCGIRYGDFRTGLTFREVYHYLWDRDRKRRRTVLGKWHELKRQLWEHHVDLGGCEQDPRNLVETRFEAGVPF